MGDEKEVNEVVWRGAEELRRFLVPIDDLLPHPRNPMVQYPAHRIAKSLRDFSQVRAITTWANAEEFGFQENTMVAGHHVHWAARLQDDPKWTHVAAIPATFESAEAALRYLSLDNLLGQMTKERFSGQMTIADEAGAFEGYDPEFREELEATLKYAPEMTKVTDLKVHERSTRKDVEDLVEHWTKQLEQHGFTKKVIVARDGTILSGEAVFRAAAVLGMSRVPVERRDIDPDSPEALQIMAMEIGDGKRALIDDRAFSELLRSIHDDLETLEGTGYDPDMLANLVMISRTTAEIRDANQAMEWIGLPEYEKVGLPAKLILSFDSEEARDQYMDEQGIPIRKRNLGTVASWWPPRERDDVTGLRFVGEDRPEGTGDEMPGHALGKKHADLLAAEEAS